MEMSFRQKISASVMRKGIKKLSHLRRWQGKMIKPPKDNKGFSLGLAEPYIDEEGNTAVAMI